MKKQWKSALFAVLLSTVLFSCGSGESSEPSKEEQKQIEMNEHLIELRGKIMLVEDRFKDVDSVEAYDKAMTEINDWDANFQVELYEKYNN